MANIESVKLPDNTSYNIHDATAQPATLVTPLTIEGVTQTTVEGALGGLNTRAFSNPNLLMNPWFTVNQRGVVSLSTNADVGKYLVDRWYADAKTTLGTLTVTSNGIQSVNATLPAYNRIEQPFEDERLNLLTGKTLTMSVLLSDGTIKCGAINSFDPTTDMTFFEDNSIMLAYKISTKKNFRIGTKVDCTVKAVKLEIGSTSTLHLDTAPDYTTELLKCQRYFRRLSTPLKYSFLGVCRADSSQYAFYYVRNAVPMRALPTVSYSGSYSLVQSESTTYSVSNIYLRNYSALDNITLVIVTSGMTAGTVVDLMSATDNSYIDLSAEV